MNSIITMNTHHIFQVSGITFDQLYLLVQRNQKNSFVKLHNDNFKVNKVSVVCFLSSSKVF